MSDTFGTIIGDTLTGRKAPRAGGRRPKTRTDRRICDAPNCTTILSRYNLSTTCRVHTPITFPRVRGVPS